MKIVITQPNYLPWLGYFAQINSCDQFVVLDDVQFARREWQNRNRIINREGKISFLTLPIKKAPRSTKINEIRVAEGFDFKQHLAVISDFYQLKERNSEMAAVLASILDNSLLDSSINLSCLNTHIFEKICNLAGIKPVILYSSQVYPILGNDNLETPTERLLNICKQLGADVYLSSPGAKQYMQSELYKFQDCSIEVLWQNFCHKSYGQSISGKPFMPFMSIIDYICNSDIASLRSYLEACHFEID